MDRVRVGKSTIQLVNNQPRSRGVFEANMATAANIQFGILWQWADGQRDFYLYKDEVEFKRHVKQFKEWMSSRGEFGGRIIWSSQKIR